jgi:hypothetical protein
MLDPDIAYSNYSTILTEFASFCAKRGQVSEACTSSKGFGQKFV